MTKEQPEKPQTNESPNEPKSLALRDLFIAVVAFTLWASFCFCSGLGIRLAIIGGRVAATMVFEPQVEARKDVVEITEVPPSVIVASQPTVDISMKPTKTVTAKATTTASSTSTAIPPTKTATSTPTATEVDTATPSPTSTMTPSKTPKPTDTATATRRPTRRRTATATRTRTPRPSATVTNSPTRRSSPTVTPTNTPLPTATPKSYPQPQLLSPANEVSFSDINTAIYLRWEGVGELAEDEWYDVQVWYSGEEPRGAVWVKDTKWRLDTQYHGHVILWRVGVIRGENSEVQRNLSPYSETRQFNWHL